jgi:hypothetical protein
MKQINQINKTNQPLPAQQTIDGSQHEINEARIRPRLKRTEALAGDR